jgi:hypothetical protein
MRRILFPLAALAAVSSLSAQHCPEGAFGTPLGTGDEVVFAIQPIGFAFPFATWESVSSHTTTTLERFQIQLQVATGNITIVFDAMSPAGNAYTGYSIGGTSRDPGSIDLSVVLGARAVSAAPRRAGSRP